MFPLLRVMLMGGALVAAVCRADPASGPTNAPPVVPGTNAPLLMRVADLPFPVGEVLTYRVYWGYWGYIPVAVATARFDWVELDGRKMIAIRSTARTNKFADKIYRVDDLMESIVDPETMLPVRFTKIAHEGRYWTHEITVYDHKNKVAHYESKKNGEKQDYPLEADTHDVISMMYVMRSQPFVVGQKPHYRCLTDDKIYDFWVDVLKEEKVELENYGAAPCVKVEPVAAFNGLFVRKGRIWFWLTRDKRQFMTKMG
ncbi:MAG: DUF3108 domain-containing protein, partial [Kiritimatiellaeota bacterium]|nr:DUF3108 domain-containing protein [Kiritimatiellota bacterium]